MNIKEENKKGPNITKEQEIEIIPLIKMEITRKIKEKKNHKIVRNPKIYLCYLFIIFLFLISIKLYLIFKNQTEKSNNSNLLIQEEKKKDNNKILHNNYTQQNKNNLTTEAKSEVKDNKQLKIGFIYSILTGNGISRFLVTTGDYFIKRGIKVYFFTKPKPQRNNELKYDENIQRFYGYNNKSLIKEICLKDKLDFLIVNNVFDTKLIQWYKSLGVKVIGLYHGVFLSPFFNNSTRSYRNWKNLEKLDAYIHLSSDDYFFYENLGFKRNLFIPNLYTYEPSNTPISNLTYHNIMMLGRLNDKKKGLIYALEAMNLIVKKVPDAKLYAVSSDGKSNLLNFYVKKYNLQNNVFLIPYTPNITNYLSNTSVFLFPSLTEAYPMALNEAKSYGLPCVTFDVLYSVPFQSGVISVKMFDTKKLAEEIIKLLKDYNYRLEKGKEAKLSLNKYNNDEIIDTWIKLFKSLKAGENEFQKLREEIKIKTYDKRLAKEHLKKNFEYLRKYNKFTKCHSLENLTNINYLNKIDSCSDSK